MKPSHCTEGKVQPGNLLLEIKNLSKSFPLERNFFGKVLKSLRAVHDINLDIYQGECLCLVGESGSGKSTTARLILNLIDSDSGEVIFDGVNLLELNYNQMRKYRKDLQMVFQNPFSSLDPRYKIFDIIAEPLQIHHKSMSRKAISERVYELLGLVELDFSIADKYPHQCSGGQNQRVSIARALSLNPKFLIADEAVSALDVSIQWTVLELFQKLRRELGLTILFITHNLGVVQHIADRVAVMYLGEIVELASKEELFAKPLHPYTQALLASAPIPDPHKRNRPRVLLEGEIPKASEIPSGCAFHTRCPKAIAACSDIRPQFVAKSTGHLVSCDLV